MIDAVQQKRTPIEERVAQVKKHLIDSESPSTTVIRTGFRIGVSDDMVREAAEKEGFRWVGYTGSNDREMHFQRPLPTSGGER